MYIQQKLYGLYRLWHQKHILGQAVGRETPAQPLSGLSKA